MDNGEHVLTHEYQQAGRIEQCLSLVSQGAQVGFLGSRQVEHCDTAADCHCDCVEDHKSITHDGSHNPSLWRTQRMKSFSFQRRHGHLHSEARRYSSDASPRSRAAPLSLSSLPKFESPLDPCWNQEREMDDHDLSQRRSSGFQLAAKPRHSQSWPSATTMTPTRVDFGVIPLLTPPEDLDRFTWTTCSSTGTPASRQESLSSDSDNRNVTIQARHSSDRSTERPSTITLPAQGIVQGEGGPSTWLSRAVQTIGKSC
jgi:hypothetical protein